MAHDPPDACRRFEEEVRATCERYIREYGVHPVFASLLDVLQWLQSAVMLEYVALNTVAKTHPDEFLAQLRQTRAEVLGQLASRPAEKPH